MQDKLKKLGQQIDEYGLSSVRDQMMELVRPAIALIPEAADEDDIPLGATKLWGLPHVPPGFDWPVSDGMMFGFLGQINLEELKATYDLGLPNDGLLSFWFYEGVNSDQEHGKVFHFSSSELTVLESPPEEDERYDLSSIFDFIETAWKVRLIAFPSLPYGYYYDSVHLPLLNLSEDKMEAYKELQSSLDEVFDLPRDDYQIGGYPHRGQQDPQRLAYFKAHQISESDFDKSNHEAEEMLDFARNLRPLAQFDGHNLDVEDSSEGIIYFLYREQQLFHHHFENPYTLLDFES